MPPGWYAVSEVEPGHFLCERAVDADSKHAADQRLRQMNIELIAEPLLITERSASEDLEAVDQAGDSQPQAGDRAGDRRGPGRGFEQHKQQREEKGSPTWGGAPTRRCQWRTISCAGVELGGGLSPALLFLIEVRRVSPVMFEQTVLQVQAQKLHVAAVKLAIERPRAAVFQRLQIGIIV